MTKPTVNSSLFDGSATYEIRVQGIIAASWVDRLEGMVISVSESEDSLPVTTLVGKLTGQSAFTGVINTLYDLHLPVLSVKRIEDAE